MYNKRKEERARMRVLVKNFNYMANRIVRGYNPLSDPPSFLELEALDGWLNVFTGCNPLEPVDMVELVEKLNWCIGYYRR